MLWGESTAAHGVSRLIGSYKGAQMIAFEGGASEGSHPLALLGEFARARQTTNCEAKVSLGCCSSIGTNGRG